MTATVQFILNSVMTVSPRTSNLTDEFHIRLFAINRIKLKIGEWRTQNVCDSFWRFYVNDRDGAIVKTPQQDFKLRANHLYFVAEDVFFSCANAKPFGHFYAHFDVLGLPRPVLHHFFAAPLEIENAPELLQEARVLARRLKNGEELTPEIHCRTKALLFGALSRVFSARAADIGAYWQLAQSHEPVAPALEYIESHLHAPLTGEVLARCCHWSADHFARRFRECVGQTAAQYVQTRRVAVASQQLLFTGKSVEQIARETGFADRFHFSRVFSQTKGCAPVAYRKRARV